MSKHREPLQANELDDDAVRDLISEIEYDLDDEEFFKLFEPKKMRKRKTGRGYARRQIDEYWEDRRLSERITEYYDDPRSNE
jgi:hypothetical protein